MRDIDEKTGVLDGTSKSREKTAQPDRDDSPQTVDRTFILKPSLCSD